jgi:DNA-binding MarR family transcriptional regulator
MSRRRATVDCAAAQAWWSVLELASGHRDRLLRTLRDLGLSPVDLRVLASLDDDAPRSMGSLAGAWGCDASTVTWAIDRLERQGLVERQAVLTDRRVKAVTLTRLGQTTKTRLFERLSEPPPEFLALDRATLERLRDVIGELPGSLRGAPWELPADVQPRTRKEGREPAAVSDNMTAPGRATVPAKRKVSSGRAPTAVSGDLA